MSSDPKKVIDSDRPRYDAADPASAPVERTDHPATDQPDDLDKLVFSFLEHVNSVTAEYESSHETSTERLDALISGLNPGPDGGANPTELATAVPDEDGAGAPDPAPLGSPAVQDQDTVPVPFIRPASELDGTIARTVDELEELSAAVEPAAPRVMDFAPVADPGHPSILPAPLPPTPRSEGPSTDAPDDSTSQAASAVASTPEETPAPNPEETLPAEGTEEYDRTLWVLSSPPEPSRRKILIRVAVIVYLVITGILLYFMFRPHPRSTPSVPSGSTALPAAPGGQVEPTEAPVVGMEPADDAQGPASEATTAAAAGPISAPQEAKSAPATSTRVGDLSSPALPSTASRPAPRPTTETRRKTPPAIPEVAQRPTQIADASQRAPSEASAAVAQRERDVPAAQPPAAEKPDTSAALPGSSTAAIIPLPIPTSLPPPAPAPRLPTASPAGGATGGVSPSTPPGSQAVLVSRVLPVFPDVARKRNMSGTVDLEIEIDAQGKVTKAKSISGPQLFHAAAEDAVRRWRFKPATLGGNNVASQGKVTVVFTNQR